MIRKFTLALGLVFMLSIYNHRDIPAMKLIDTTAQINPVIEIKPIKVKATTTEKIKHNRKFCKLLSNLESGHDFTIVNVIYIGKYQFGPSALQQVECPIDIEEFKSNPNIFDSQKQDSVLFLLMKWNKMVLRHHIKKYEGLEIKGIIVTRAGMLAAAHLGGAGSVMKFLETEGEEDFRDGNGVPVSRYLKLFENQQIHLEHYL